MKRLLYLLTIALTITMFSHNGNTAVVTDGLVSYWTFDREDVDGGTVRDVWGKNDAIIRGDPKLVNGILGRALKFDGTNDYVNLTNLGDFGSWLGTSTFEAWLKTSLKRKRWTTLFKVRDADCGMGWGIDLNAWSGLPNLAVNPGNFDDNISFAKDIIRLYLALKPGADKCEYMASGWDFPISDGEWHHLVYVNGAPYVDEDGVKWQERAIFIDGKREWLTRHKDWKPSYFTPFIEPVYLGAGNNRGKAEAFFNGIIDEVRIYNRPLTAAEVTQNFKIEFSVKTTEKLPVLWGTLKATP